MKIYKKVLILFLSILLIFIISIFAVKKSENFKKKVKLYLPFDLITFFKVVTNFDGNLFSHYENDYKVKFLPETAFVSVMDPTRGQHHYERPGQYGKGCLKDEQWFDNGKYAWCAYDCHDLKCPTDTPPSTTIVPQCYAHDSANNSPGLRR